MATIWVVAADSSRARIFSTTKPAAALDEVQTLTNPQARLHEGDLLTDRGGRGSSAAAVHNYSNGDTVKTQVANRFAAALCKHLEKGRHNNAFDKLYVLAAPQFLGLMRKHLSTGLKSLIGEEMATDLTLQPAERIRAHLPQYL